MYMGGNGFYWITALDPTGRYIEVRREHGTEAWQGAPGETYHATTGEVGGLWHFRGRPPQMLVGVGFTAQGFDRNSPFRRMPGSFDPRAAFIFEGIDADELIGEHPSLVLEVGAAGSELDRVDYALGSPPHTLILATSFGHSDAYQQVVEEVNTSDSRQGGTANVLVKADMAYVEYPNGGAVFSTSSIAWSGSLSYNGYDNNVSRITENVLRRFASDEPIPWPALPGRVRRHGRRQRQPVAMLAPGSRAVTLLSAAVTTRSTSMPSSPLQAPATPTPAHATVGLLLPRTDVSDPARHLLCISGVRCPGPSCNLVAPGSSPRAIPSRRPHARHGEA